MQQLRQSHIINEYPENQESRIKDLPDDQTLPTIEEDFSSQYSEEDMETLHVYLYEEKPRKRSPNAKETIIGGVELALLALALLGICLLPNTPAYSITTITIPAHFSMQQFQATSTILPTGKRAYPATRATGMLTIYNGSILAQQLPANFILTASNGVEVATDQAVMIPGEDSATNPPSNGKVSVSAHTIIAGADGNIQAGAINAVYGSSLYVKNLTPFTGGQDAYTKQYVTSDDTTTALTAARRLLAAKQPLGLMAKPCTEHISQHSLSLFVTWACEYVTYQVPKDGQVISVQVSGNTVILKMRIAARVTTTHFVK